MLYSLLIYLIPLIGKDRESHQKDLYQNIEKGDFPKWDMKIQIMPEKDAAKLPYNLFDLTKVWFQSDYPLIDVGVLELNRNPENYFAEVEQSAFNPANVVPGLVFPRIKCCRVVYFLMQMPKGTAFVSTITKSR